MIRAHFGGEQHLEFPNMTLDEFGEIYEKALGRKLVEIRNPQNGKRTIVNMNQLTIVEEM
jgi:hypothetical protein